jgi:hypothetical protein
MKSNLIYILIVLYQTTQIQAQTITTSWAKISYDSTLKNCRPFNSIMAGENQRVYPEELLSDNQSNIYVLNSTTSAWQVEKLSSDNGRNIWKTSRNYTTPKLDSLQYFVSDFFIGKNNSVEVLGTELAYNYPNVGLFVAGPAARAVYDMQSGKELSYHSLSSRFNRGAWIWNRGKNRFIKKKDGYFIIDPVPYKGEYGILRKVSTDLMQVDTIAEYKEDSLSSKKNSQWFFKPYYINNTIFYTVGMLEGLNRWDSTRFFFRYYKLDTLGNILKQKDFNKETYRFFGLTNHWAVKDGFVWAGYADPEKKYGQDDNYQYYIQKLDTNLNIKWRVLLPKKNKQFNYVYQLVELQNNQGYLVLNSDQDNSKQTLLYHVSLSGQAKYLGEVRLKDIDKGFSTRCMTQLPNQDIAFGFFLTDCYSAALNSPYCGGVGLIKYSSIENLVNAADLQISEIIPYTIFPNPVQEKVSIKFSEEQKGKMTIFDLQGKELLQAEQEVLSEIWDLNLSSLQSGIYFLQLQLKNGEIRTERLVKE